MASKPAERRRRGGLPAGRGLERSSHYIEELTGTRSQPVGVMMQLERIEPNPHQPRRSFEDIEDLARSIAERGVLEPLLVRPNGKHYQIVAGERRYRAAQSAGLSEVPVIVLRDLAPEDSLEIALIENLQRQDLSAFEEAEALGRLVAEFGYTHEQLAQRLGRSRSAVTESLNLNGVPPEVRAACDKAGLKQKSKLLALARERSPEKMLELLPVLAAGELDRKQLARQRSRRGPGRPKSYVFRCTLEEPRVRLELKFSRARASSEDVIEALESLLEQLRASHPG